MAGSAHPAAERLQFALTLRLLCAAWQDAIKVDAKNPLARFERAAVLEDQGRLQEALHELTALKVLWRTSPPALHLLPACDGTGAAALVSTRCIGTSGKVFERRIERFEDDRLHLHHARSLVLSTSAHSRHACCCCRSWRRGRAACTSRWGACTAASTSWMRP
jgi:hypothetical protein